MKNLGKYLPFVAALTLASPLSAQENSGLEVRTRVCDIGEDLPLPIAVIAKGEEPLYAVINSSPELVLDPMITFWRNPIEPDTAAARGDVNRGRTTVKIPCRWADENEKVLWVSGFIPSDNISLKGNSVYITMGGQQFQYALPERD